jgi:hypothetical protein
MLSTPVQAKENVFSYAAAARPVWSRPTYYMEVVNGNLGWNFTILCYKPYNTQINLFGSFKFAFSYSFHWVSKNYTKKQVLTSNQVLT